MDIFTILKKPFFGRFQRPWVWPASVPESGWTRVEFRNGSGARMVGLHGRALATPTRAIVVMPHPMIAEAKGYVMASGHADLLRQAGYDVLVFDFNGFGESEDGGWDYPGDIVAAGRKATELAPDLPVALFGMSMGAGYGVCAMDTPDHPFEAAVIENAFTTLEEFWVRFRFAYAMLRMLNVVMPGPARQLRPITRIRTIRGVESILFIYGEADKLTPPSMGERLIEACPLPPERRSLWRVPHAKHIRALSTAPDEYRRRVLDFLHAAFHASS